MPFKRQRELLSEAGDGHAARLPGSNNDIAAAARRVPECQAMDLLRALAMPFQLASLLFVALTSLLLSVVLSPGILILGMVALYLTMVSLTRYAFRMIEDAADGCREAAVVDVGMFNPVGDGRCWVHPALGGLLLIVHLTHPQWPVAPTLIAVALLFPPSIVAMVVRGRGRDALDPRAIGAAIRGLGSWYPLVVLATAGCAAASVLLAHALDRSWLMFLGLQLLLLLACAFIGGAVFVRRFELGFAARRGPERKLEAQLQERAERRQQMLDAVYNDLRVRETSRALAHVRQWMQAAAAHEWPGDVDTMLAAMRTWDQPRELPRLLQGLMGLLLEERHVTLAMHTAETALAADPAFAPATELATIALVNRARATGRRRLALRLLQNHLRRLPPGQLPGAALEALREQLEARP